MSGDDIETCASGSLGGGASTRTTSIRSIEARDEPVSAKTRTGPRSVLEATVTINGSLIRPWRLIGGLAIVLPATS
jgi:hypothetical protein